MSVKGEKYKSKGAAKKHERGESVAEATREYGKKPAKVKKVMHEWKAGTLHSGKGGPVVKSRKQAIAIAMSQAGMAKPKRGQVRKAKRK